MTAPAAIAQALLGRVVDPHRLARTAQAVLPVEDRRAAARSIAAWSGYAPTPLIPLPGLARALGLGAVSVKDEGGRFGLGSFKALGGAYAVAELAAAATTVPVFTCATDGNHGRAVAWGASQMRARCVVFLHARVSAALAAAIAAFGAEIVRVPGTYDDAVRLCAGTAERAGWTVVSDTAWPGYEAVPRMVMCGYALIADEIAAAAGTRPPTHVLLQGGVGGMAATLLAALADRFPDPLPRFIVVEPASAACLLASARRGAIVAVPGPHETVAAGLACGEPSTLAWPILEAGAADFLAVTEPSFPAAVRRLACPFPGDAAVVAGPSGAGGLAGLLAACGDSETRTRLGLNAESRVLVVNTESDTDPDAYRQILAEG